MECLSRALARDLGVVGGTMSAPPGPPGSLAHARDLCGVDYAACRSSPFRSISGLISGGLAKREPPAPGRKDHSDATVLVIEDEPPIQKLVAVALRRAG